MQSAPTITPLALPDEEARAPLTVDLVTLGGPVSGGEPRLSRSGAGAWRLDVTADSGELVAVRFTTSLPFAAAVFGDGVVQRTTSTPGWSAPDSPAVTAYAMSTARSFSVSPEGGRTVVVWREEHVEIWVIVGGDARLSATAFTPGDLDLLPLLAADPSSGAVAVAIDVRVENSAAPNPFPDAVSLPTERDALLHRLALWGSQVPSIGSLELPGSAYPTINLPRREYGDLHTFFDPDAWSVVAALSFSGVPELRAEARSVIERALAAIQPDGLVPHHFDGDEATYVAISGSPQPGPNLFLVEAALDHACATGDLDWLADAWQRGLRAALDWVLGRVDTRHGLLQVEGALWVDVFRRRGLTLDTNAMAVRTLRRAAEAAAWLGDDLAARATDAAALITRSLGLLWAGDHFVTSVDPETGAVADHLDAENYLAIATGAATAEQSAQIFGRFDAAPQMHPGGRGTWVSLVRYDGEDCFLHNTGDSDVAMARLYWADLKARWRTGDRAGFLDLFDAVADDLLTHVWMRERYSAGGHLTRARGYHEYPGVLDNLLREAVIGLELDILSARLRPMRSGAFAASFGEIAVEYSADRIHVSLPGIQERTIHIDGLPAEGRYRTGDGATVVADASGSVTVTAQSRGGSHEITLTRVAD